MSNIPSVNLSDFLSKDESHRKDFVSKIGKAYQEIGFVSLKGHFLSENNIDDLYSQIKKFFDLPKEIKNKYEFDGFKGQRGYTSFGKEHAKGKKEGDLKEFWHFGQYIDKNNKDFNYPQNITVEEFPEFNQAGFNTYKALEKTGIYVLRAIALFLDLEEEWKSRKEWTPTIEFDLFFEKPEVVRKKRSSIALILRKFLPERIVVGKNCNFFYIRSDLYPQDLTYKPNEYIRLDREDLLEQYME